MTSGTIEAGLGQGQIYDDFSISPSSRVSATLSTYYGKTLTDDSTVRDKRPSPVLVRDSFGLLPLRNNPSLHFVPRSVAALARILALQGLMSASVTSS